MYKYLSKNGVLLGFLLAVICVVIMFIPIWIGLDAFDALPDKVNERAVAPEGNIFLLGIFITLGLLAVAVAAALIGGLFGIVTNFKASTKGLIAFGALAVLFLILYSVSGDMSSATGSLATTVANPEFGIDDGIFKLVNGGITGTMWLLFAAFILMIGMEIWNFFKNA